MRRNRDCEQLGLPRPERAALTGFTGRAAAALAHLREAWCVADGGNRPWVEAAIRELLGAPELARRPARYEAVLAAGLDVGLAQALIRAARQPRVPPRSPSALARASWDDRRTGPDA